MPKAPPDREFWLKAADKVLRWRILKLPEGHYYAPTVAVKEVMKDAERVFDLSLRDIPGIEVHVQEQLALLSRFQQYYPQQPFGHYESQDARYFFDNLWFQCADALYLYLMIRESKPKRIIEIGSGFSSFVMLDTSERFFDNSIEMTFIEPDSKRLRSRMRPADHLTAKIIEERVQHLDLRLFETLEAGDILFVDSSHVCKVDSDVNHIVFEIMPRLAPGVLIHFHDIRYPFEYPKGWVEYGVAWSEAYLLRAFLQYNSSFKIKLWADYIRLFLDDKVRDPMPLLLEPVEYGLGGSLWLEKTN